MSNIDVCNGDADGLCAVIQWRLHEPAASHLVTGLKRDIELLERVQATRDDQVLVCDVSMRRNRVALLRLLDLGVRVRYFDHHEAGEFVPHPGLEAHVNTATDVCTSLLVDRHIGSAYRAWALVGAYGDNLTAVADALAAGMGLSAAERLRLRTLGEAINYNAYGDSERDVCIPPARLYDVLIKYRNPLDLASQDPIMRALHAMREDDLALAAALTPLWQNARGRLYLLPEAPWSGRIIGTLINTMASKQPHLAHAILKPAGFHTLLVSVRAPLDSPCGAMELCRQFAGDGRAAAAGIDHLPTHEMQRFITAFSGARWGQTAPSHTQG